MIDHELKFLWAAEVLARLHENWPAQVAFRLSDVIAATGGFIAEAHISRTIIVWDELGKFLEDQRILRIGARTDSGNWDRVELTPHAAELLVKGDHKSAALFGGVLRLQVGSFVQNKYRPEEAVKDVVRTVEAFLDRLSRGDAPLAETASQKRL